MQALFQLKSLYWEDAHWRRPRPRHIGKVCIRLFRAPLVVSLGLGQSFDVQRLESAIRAAGVAEDDFDVKLGLRKLFAKQADVIVSLRHRIGRARS